MKAQSCPNFPVLLPELAQLLVSWLRFRDALFKGYEKWLRASSYAVGLSHFRVAVTSSPVAQPNLRARRTADDFYEKASLNWLLGVNLVHRTFHCFASSCACCLLSCHEAFGGRSSSSATVFALCAYDWDWDLGPTQCVVTVGNSFETGKVAASCLHSRVA